jgi:hypothetical protein
VKLGLPPPPLPYGDYAVQIVYSDLQPNNNTSGKHLLLALLGLDVVAKGRVIFDCLNLVNPNEWAVQQARKRLAQICWALGVPQLQDTEVLHFKPLQARLVVKPETIDGDGVVHAPRNEVLKYMPLPKGG